MKFNKGVKPMGKKLLSALLSLVLIVSLAPTVAYGATGYTDVSTNDWYYPAVEYMAGQKYMTGYSDTTFAPKDTLSRAMFVTILYRVSGEKVASASTKFTDVAQGTWYTEAVTWAVANGITTGTSATKFSPSDPVTREQMAVFIKRYVDAKGANMPDSYVAGVPGDLSNTSAWAKDAVQFAYGFGILVADRGMVNPRNNATREDAVVAFYNFLVANGKVTDGGLLLPNTYVDEGNTDDGSCNHQWETVHIPGSGHYETGGTHRVMFTKCNCGYTVNSDMPNVNDLWREHSLQCRKRSIFWYEDVPNSEPVYVEDWPAKDVTYCPLCGAEK